MSPFAAKPTLVVGLGGTGLKAATYIKKSLLEANQNALPSGMAILVLDTEKEIKFQAGGWGRERDRFHATGPVAISGGQYRPLTGSVRGMGTRIRAEQVEMSNRPELRREQPNRHISSWFQARYYMDEVNVPEQTWDLSVGAGRYRQFGRLGLFRHISAQSVQFHASRPIGEHMYRITQDPYSAAMLICAAVPTIISFFQQLATALVAARALDPYASVAQLLAAQAGRLGCLFRSFQVGWRRGAAFVTRHGLQRSTSALRSHAHHRWSGSAIIKFVRRSPEAP